MSNQDEDKEWEEFKGKWYDKGLPEELALLQKVTSKEYQDSIADKNAEMLLKTPRYEA